MKHFIYMDTDIINSYISQFNEGITVNTHIEVRDETSNGITKNETDPCGNSKLEFSIPTLFKAGFESDNQLFSQTESLVQLQSGRELIDKILHDNSFNQFLNFLQTENMLKNTDYSIGDYVEINGTYDLWNLDYLIGLFDDYFIDFLTKNQINEISSNSLSKEGKKNNSNAMRKVENEVRNSFKENRNIMEMCRNILPFTQFMMIDNCFIPLKQTYLRESTNEIRFKYTGNIHLIGRYTNDYKNTSNSPKSSAFSEIFSYTDEATKIFLKEGLNIPDDAKIITPIALYFE